MAAGTGRRAVKAAREDAVMTVIGLIHEWVETPCSARKAAQMIVAAADRRCPLIDRLCRLGEVEAALEIAARLDAAGMREAADVARGYAQEVAGR